MCRKKRTVVVKETTCCLYFPLLQPYQVERIWKYKIISFHVLRRSSRQAMKASHLLLLLSVALYQLHASTARPVGLLQQQLKQAVKHQQQLQENPTDEQDEDDWNTRPIIGILTQVELFTLYHESFQQQGRPE